MGGIGAAPGSGGTASPKPVIEADTDQPCTADPLAASWHDEALDSQDDGSALQLAAGGPLALLVTRQTSGLVARVFSGDGPWSQPMPVPGTTGTDSLTRIDVSPDGSLAIVLWLRNEQHFATVYTAAGGFRDPEELAASADHVVMLTNGRAVLGYGDGDGIHALEYSASDGFVAREPVLANYQGLFADGPDTVVGFSSSSFVAGPDAAHPYQLGNGFTPAEPLPARVYMPSAYQSFFFAFPNGRAVRAIRTWGDVMAGLHVTTRKDGAWGAEQHLAAADGSLTFAPQFAYTGQNLLGAWLHEKLAMVGEHDGGAWTEQALPRSRSLQLKALVGAQASALLLGEQLIVDENVSAKKLHRRGSDGTWYCAKLLPNHIGGHLVSDGHGFWFVQRVRKALHVSRFRAPM